MSDNSDNIKGSQRSAFGQFVQSFRPRARSDSRHKPGEEPTALLTASNPHSVDVSPRSDVEDSTGSHASYAYTVVNTLPTTREDGDTLSALTPGRFARGSRHRMTSQLYPDNPAKKTWNIANLLLERKQKPKSNSPADVRDIFGPGRQRNYSGSKQLQVKVRLSSD